MRNFIFIVFFSFAAQFIHAQEVLVKGKVSDKLTSDGLIGVTVIADAKTGAVSDVNGNYSLKLTAGKHVLEFRMLGYNPLSRNLDLKAGDSLALNVILETSARALDMVVVSAGKFEQKLGDVTVSMEVISPQLLENKNTTSMENIIDQVPGVNVTDGQANIRGGSGYSYGGGSRVLLLVDDLPLLSADAGDVKWNFLPIENLQQIEVLKGASSALFGASALNGVINIRTAYPTSTPKTSVVMYSGIYDQPARPELAWWGKNNPMFKGTYFFHSRQIGNLDLVIGGNLFNNDGYRQDETERRYRFNINTRYRFKHIDGLSVGVNANYMDVWGGNFLLWANGDSGAYKPLGGKIQVYDNLRFNVDPYITYYTKDGSKHSIHTRYYYTLNTNDTHQKSIANLYYGEYQYQKQFKGGLTITAGATATYSDIKSELYNTHFSSNESGYVQFDKKFFKKLTVSFGARGEAFKLDTTRTSFYLKKDKKDTLAKLPFQPVMRLGASYQLFKVTFLRASFGQGYRFPSVAEKYIRTAVGGLEIYPNAKLGPEKGWSAEVGLKQGFQVSGFRGFLDVAAFRMEYENMMEFAMGFYGKPSDPLYGVGFKSQNIGHTQISGIDVALEGEGKIGPVLVRTMCGYTYMKPISLDFNPDSAKQKNSDSINILKYRYRHIAKADIEFSYKKYAIGFSMRYNSFMENIDKFFVDPFFSSVLPGVAAYRAKFHTGDIVFDNRISYQLNKVAKISLISNNIFNKETTSRPADVLPPRNYALQVSLKF
jgi:iron complex outermembrane receptor protein